MKRKMKAAKRYISMLLTFSLLFGLMPGTAFAAGDAGSPVVKMHGDEPVEEEAATPLHLADVERERRAYLEKAGIAALALEGEELSYETAGGLAVAGGDSGSDWVCSGNVLKVLSSTVLYIRNNTVEAYTDSAGVTMVRGTSSVTTHIYIESDVNAHIVLAGINVNTSSLTGSSSMGYPAVQIADNSKGNVTIELLDGTENVVRSGRQTAGIQKNGGISSGTLTITGTGSLEANGGASGSSSFTGGAGIGSGCRSDCANIIIDSGVIVANGGQSGAGIGGGAYGSCYNITINSGLIVATGGSYGTGIGAGDWYKLCSGITINGGTVTAKGGNTAAGIGASYYGSCEKVTINGGNVTATGGSSAAGIGGGIGSTSRNSTCKDIYITGGIVTATGGSGASGVGGGSGTVVTDVDIAGGVVIAKAGSGSEAIGGGSGNGTFEVAIDNCIIFENGEGTVRGDSATIDSDLVIPNGYTLTVGEGQSVVVGDGVTVSGSGTIENNGSILLEDGSDVQGLVTGTGTVEQDKGAVQYEIGSDDVTAVGDAFWDSDTYSFVLTENESGKEGSIWFSQIQKDNNFEIELEFFTGDSSEGGDGIWITFFADRGQAGADSMGFFDAGGYSVELDTYTGEDDLIQDPVNFDHLAFLRRENGGSINHLYYVDATDYTEDGEWHTLRITNQDGVCSAYVDNECQLQYSGVDSTGSYDIGISAATNKASNKHAVRNIKLTESGMRKIAIPGGVIRYGRYSGAVYGCEGSPSVLVLPEEAKNVPIQSIAPGAFAEITSLEWVYIPESVIDLGENAFAPDTLLLFESAEQAQRLLAGQNYQWDLAGISEIGIASDLEEDGHRVIGGDYYTLDVTEKPARGGGLSLSAVDSAGNVVTLGGEILETVAYAGYSIYRVRLNLTALSTGLYTFTFSPGGGYGNDCSQEIFVNKEIPTTPVGFTAETVSGSVHLRWSAVIGGSVKGYKLYRSDSLTGDFQWLADVEGVEVSTYTDNTILSGQEYFYKLSAVNEFNAESIYAGPVSSLYGADTTPPKIVGMSPANRSTVSGNVSFTVSAEDDSLVSLIGMQVSSDGKTWTELTAKSVSAKSAKAVFTVDTAQFPDGTLYLQAYAADYVGNEGRGATTYQYTIDNTPPEQVTGLAVKSQQSTILTLSWDDVEAEDFSYFSVEKMDSSGQWREYAKVTKTLGVNVTGLTPGQEYSFRVWMVEGSPESIYHAGDTVNVDEGITFVAVWKKNTYIVSFDSDGRFGTMDAVTVCEEVPYSLPACRFTADSSELFEGWLIGDTVYQPGEEVLFTADTVVKAKWKQSGAESSPTPGASVSPSPAPDVSPSLSPAPGTDPSPSPTSETSPNPVPDVSPSPNPTAGTDLSPTPGASASPSPAPGASASPSPTPGASASPTPGASVSPNPTPGASASPSPTPGASASPSPTPGASASPSPTPGASASPSPTPGASASPSPTPGASVSPSPTPGASASPSPTPGASASPSPTPGASVSPSPTPGASASPSPTPWASVSPNPTPGASASPSPRPWASVSPNPTPGASASPSPSPTSGTSPSQVPDVNSSPNPTAGTNPSPTPRASASASPSPTPRASASPSPTPRASASPSPTPGTSAIATPSPKPGMDDIPEGSVMVGDLTYYDGKYYFYEDGQMAVSKEAVVNGAWRWFDEDGVMAVSKDVYLTSSGGKWVRYDEDGAMVKGREDYRYGGWYSFDSITGAMAKGPVVLEDGREVFYDVVSGQMKKGKCMIEGKEYQFDEIDGHRISGQKTLFWLHIDGKAYWYEDWLRQGWNPADLSYRGKEIYYPASDAWYWLDNVQNGAMAASKDVYLEDSLSAYPDREGGVGKWVRYDAEGRMVKGWDTNEDGTYYFEAVTGAMAKGMADIDMRTYYFDPVTGICQTGKMRNILSRN